MYIQSENGRTNWVTHDKNILYRYGFGFAFMNHGVGDTNSFLSLFKKTDYGQEWQSNVSDSPKLLSYKLYKYDFVLEHYLHIVDIRKYMIALSRFRCSNHKLEIEIGRHSGIPRNKRLCKYCLENRSVANVEDEYHFICICPQYINLRNKYFGVTFLANLNNFIKIMSSKTKKEVINLACFIYHASKVKIASQYK